MQEISVNLTDHPDCTTVQGLILKKGCIWLPKGLRFIPILLNKFHVTRTRGHIGITKTLVQVRENFIWTEIKDDASRLDNCARDDPQKG